MLRIKYPAGMPTVQESLDRLLKRKQQEQLQPELPPQVDPVDELKPEIYRDFTDPYLQLTMLLYQASALEHTLMVQYLYATFSIKEEYEKVRGTMSLEYYMAVNSDTLLGVSVEEMQHLRMVSEYLADIGGAPNLVPQIFPYVNTVYPFPMDLTPLSQYTTAQYVWVESSNCALDPRCNPGDIDFIRQIYAMLGQPPYPHLGTLYQSILDYTDLVRANPPPFLRDRPVPVNWEYYIANMRHIAIQGETDHYMFFRSVFLSTHPGFKGRYVWGYPENDPLYPAIQFYEDQTTAYEGLPNSIKDPTLRDLAWLGDLHYWILLALLDVSFRVQNQKDKYKSVNNMTMALYAIAIYLAKNRIGFPFDPMPWNPCLGRTDDLSLQVINQLVLEAQELANRYRPLLEANGYNFKIFEVTLANINTPT